MTERNNSAGTILRKMEAFWPILTGKAQISFDRLRGEMETFLIGQGVLPRAFSHFGLIVKSIESSLGVISGCCDLPMGAIRPTWVEAYAVYVARYTREGKEIEFIEPSVRSSFYGFLKDTGEGLHHLGFWVSGLQSGLKRLSAGKVKIIDQRPRQGSHGLIAFVLPAQFKPIHIELCQQKDDNKRIVYGLKGKMRT